jgi:hypothetical protein
MQRIALMIAIVLLALSSTASAVQLDNYEFISPITGKKFHIIAIPVNQINSNANAALADMGADDDGCRHASGGNEYEYYIATCPYSYFTALSIEWDGKSGRFLGDITPETKAWVVGKDGFNGEWVIDVQHAYQRVNHARKLQGQPAIDRNEFVMEQQDVPLERRYRYALQCYEKRGARPAVIAKVALTGAWAIRARLNVAVGDSSLAGGFEEVNDKADRHISEGETFSLNKWAGIYHDIFYKSRLSDEGYMVAGMVYLGYALREGDHKVVQDVLEKMQKRFEGQAGKNDGKELMRGLVRERKRMVSEYNRMLEVASANFASAIATEEFTRARLPEVMLVVAECLRRTARDQAAIDWYMALAKMEETQPNLRGEIRAQKKAPGPDAPYLVQLGWIADRHLEDMTAAGVVHPNEISGPDKNLLNEILNGGLGTLEYENKTWKPGTGGNQTDCGVMLSLVGKAVLDYHQRVNEWPEQLGELWTKDVIRDRNRVNRFHDPVTGKPFLYSVPKGPRSEKTVLIATELAIPTNQGPRFGAYLHNDSVVWSDRQLNPGDVYNR